MLLVRSWLRPPRFSALWRCLMASASFVI
jgi:hypothetical protein